MLFNTNQRPVSSGQYLIFIKKRSRLSWSLFLGLTGLVLIFNIISIYVPNIIGAPLWPGTVISIGIVFSYLIILLIVLAAIYYVHWNNSALLRLKAELKEQEKVQ